MEYLQGAQNFLFGPGLIPQLLFLVLALLVLVSLITAIENVVGAVTQFDRLSSPIMPDTTPTTQTVVQDPDSGVPLIYNSVNESNGMEFSYSMYLFINPDTFETSAAFGDEGAATGSATPVGTSGRSGAPATGSTTPDGTVLKHIFHKGNREVFPLMSPGLFVSSKSNTLRLYMNSTTRWDNYVEIPNVPVNKWFHVVITMKGKYLDVYVNGNVTVRHEFDTVPKLNYGNVYIMYPAKFPNSATDAVTGFRVDGAMKGMVSRLNYYAFALNYSQIDSLYRQGPSKKIVSQSYSELPPYFHDDWWVTRY